jgi:hypothetical protein
MQLSLNALTTVSYVLPQVLTVMSCVQGGA